MSGGKNCSTFPDSLGSNTIFSPSENDLVEYARN